MITKEFTLINSSCMYKATFDRMEIKQALNEWHINSKLWGVIKNKVEQTLKEDVYEEVVKRLNTKNNTNVSNLDKMIAKATVQITFNLSEFIEQLMQHVDENTQIEQLDGNPAFNWLM